MDGFPSEGDIATVEDLSRLLDMISGLHDGIVKEMHWVNRDYVNTDLSMFPYSGSACKILVQRQWPDPSAVELTLFGLQWLRLDARNFVFDSAASAEGQYLKLVIEDSEFVFETMKYRYVTGHMGPSVRFGLPFDEVE